MDVSCRFLEGIWAAVPTPFRADGSLDLTGIERNAAYFERDLGLAGLFCNGVMGEGWALSLAERKDALEAHLAGAAGRLRVGVVTTHHSLSETIDLSRHAARAGADHMVLMRPAGPFSADELHDFVEAIAKSVDRPIVLFDAVAQSGGYPPDVIRRLAREGHVAGVKCTRDADSINALREFCGDLVMIADPYESHWLGNLIRYDLCGLYADPEPYLFQLPGCRLIHDYSAVYRLGELQEAARLCRKLEPLRSVYDRWILAPLRRGAPLNAALKHWCMRLGLAAGPVRAPSRPLTAEQACALDDELDAALRAVFGPGIDLSNGKEAAAWRS